MATDPDADRLGVYVKDAQTGEYHSLTGNMSGCLIGDYVIGQRKELFGLPEDGAFIRSIVSTNMADAIAAYYGIDLIEVLTGFKFIGQKILEFEETGKGTYLFGMEESYGWPAGTYARDKDAVAASMMLCEAAAYYKTKNMTLWDAMLAMYKRYGYYKDDVTSITLKGIEGLAKIQEIMNTLRENAPAEIGGYKVTAVRDYKLDTITVRQRVQCGRQVCEVECSLLRDDRRGMGVRQTVRNRTESQILSRRKGDIARGCGRKIRSALKSGSQHCRHHDDNASQT